MAELTDEIRERRRGGLGGSDAPTVFGLGYGTPFSLWADKVWGSKDHTTPQQQRGHDLEPLIAQKAAAANGVVDIYEGGWVSHPEHEWMFANLDFEADGGDLIFECKARDLKWNGSAWGEDGDPEGVPGDTEIQTRHQMECRGASRAIVAVLFVDVWELRTYPLTPDPDLTEMIVEGERRFWHDHVLAEVPPPVTQGPSEWDALRQICARPESTFELPEEAAALVAEYVTARHERLNTHGPNETRLRAELARLMGDYEFGTIDGDVAVEFKNGKGRNRSLNIPSYYEKRVLSDD